jgi:ABC-type dipeptide/oligopeptide/nickel transport system ATPase component
MSILFISHDLASVYTLCHRIALLDGGEIVECNTPHEIFFNPVHAFTKRLIAALPSVPQISDHPSTNAPLAASATTH